MNLLIWMDLPLMVLGLLAMSPGLWYALRQRILCRPALGRGVRTATALVFSLGLGTLTAAGVDAGLAEWDQACRVRGKEDNVHVSMMAPDFSLPSLDEDRTIRLSDFRGHKPVVLIFGNFY
jgi:hypothetical protein